MTISASGIAKKKCDMNPPMTPAWIVFERADEAVAEDCDDPTALKVVLTAIHSHPHMQIVFGVVWEKAH